MFRSGPLRIGYKRGCLFCWGAFGALRESAIWLPENVTFNEKYIIKRFSLTFSLKIDKNMENEARIQQKWENGSPGEQKWSKGHQKWAKGHQKWAKREPKGAKSEPAGAKSEPTGAKREPKVSQIQHKININQHKRQGLEKGVKKVVPSYAHLMLLGSFWSNFPSKNDEKIDAKIDA